MTRETKEQTLLSILPFIRGQTARACRKTGMPYEDMLQEACIAAWYSLDTYEPAMGSPLTYVTKPIYWRIVSLFKQSINPIRKPEGHYPASLGPDDLLPGIQPEASTLEFDELLSACRCSDREIMREIYVEGFTQTEAAERHHLSRQRITQMHQRALNTIREALCSS